MRSDPGRLDPVFDQLRRAVSDPGLPVAALAVADAQGTIRSSAFAADGSAVASDSLFFLASVTKPIVATAFMQLVEAGLTDVHEPFVGHLPELGGGAKAQLAPWHVLTHTSGIADLDPQQMRRRRPSAAEMTRHVLTEPLRFAPGTRWEYCSASFYLLSLLVERLTGVTFVTHLRTSLLEPLGMDTTFDPRGTGRQIIPVAGIGADNRLMRWLMLRYMARAQVPGGGLFGSLNDLVAFGSATLQPRSAGGRQLPLSAATIALMGTDQTATLRGLFDGVQREVHFGLGWGKPTLMRQLAGSSRVVSHGGVTGTRLWIDPQAGLVFAYLSNRWSPDRAAEIEALAGVYRAMTA